MPSTDRRLELKEKTSMAQNASQAFVYANGLNEKGVRVWIGFTWLRIGCCYRLF